MSLPGPDQGTAAALARHLPRRRGGRAAVPRHQRRHASPGAAVDLARLLRNAAPGAQCVVLSACYSEQQSAKMLTEGILFVVGASQAINGEEANTFADVFTPRSATGCRWGPPSSSRAVPWDLSSFGRRR